MVPLRKKGMKVWYSKAQFGSQDTVQLEALTGPQIMILRGAGFRGHTEFRVLFFLSLEFTV